MSGPASRTPSADELFRRLLAAGSEVGALRDFLAEHGADSVAMLDLLRRAVPVRFLELVANTSPWSRDPRLLAGVVLNPRAPRPLAQRLLPSLLWRDLAEAAASTRVDPSVRVRAESLLAEQLPDLRLGDRISLGRIATPVVLRPMLLDPDPKVARACLLNRRLREEDLLVALRQPTVPLALLEAVADSARWRETYALRLALVLQPRTPLALALSQLSSLLPRDLERVSQTPGLAPLVQSAALSYNPLSRRRFPKCGTEGES